MVQVDLDHQHADDVFAIAHRCSKEVAALARGGAQAEEAPEPASGSFSEIRAEGEVTADKTVGLVPVGGSQGIALHIHQVHDLCTGLGSDVLQQTVGIGQRLDLQGCGQHGTQGRQVAKDLRQDFIAVQGAEQVGDIQVQRLPVLLDQFVAVIAFGQVLQRPQQRCQAQCKKGQAAPAGATRSDFGHGQCKCAG
ncbi:hypothetical protein D9M71_55710 [compost metagenome]